MRVAESALILMTAMETIRPDYIALMVSGGHDSAATYAVAVELGVKIDIIIHGNTRTGIRQTTEHVLDIYGKAGPDLVVADAGTAYEDYVMRKGFFGLGVGAHGFSYRVLKATPFRKVVSASLRQRKRGVRVMLLNGARKDESENRQAHLQVMRQDPATPGNYWVNLIHTWSQDDRDAYLKNRGVPLNPVAVQLCRSGECMCGTMQTKGDRAEASVIYPEWGEWLNNLEREVIERHGFGWGAPFPKKRNITVPGFQPMCVACNRRGVPA